MAEIVGAVAGGIAGEVAKSLWAKITGGSVFHYHRNLKDLKEAYDQLDAKMKDERKFSGETSRSLKEAGATVEKWRSNSKELHQKAEKLLSRNNISRLNQWSRCFTSRRASTLTTKIKKMVEALDFGKSFDVPIAEGGRFNIRDYMEFESRRRIQDEVLKALREDSVRMCSICGMGGIGKTMMAKKIVQIVEAEGLLANVAMVTVTQNHNFEKIQNEIIELLGVKFGDTTMQGRAKKLNHWLSNHKTLLVLDDVWWQLHAEDFEAIGIPLGTDVCKILITSRNLDACRKMGSSLNSCLNHLEEGEARDLFIQNAGNSAEDVGLQDTAKQIVDECKGLPIAVVIIAKALKGKSQEIWNDTLTKLLRLKQLGISDMETVYSKIKLSYDLLNDPEAQSCLRLCCLFPEDYNVPVDKLVFYANSLEIFHGVHSLNETRLRVSSIVDKMKSSFLLLDVDKDGYVKLHDIVRDFAIWISSTDGTNPYLVICENEMDKWPENVDYEKYHAISIVCKKLKSHPVGLRCPNLKLLQLHFEGGSGELPNDFFDGMEELRVLDVDVPSTLPPLTKQKALRTLLLRGNSNLVVPLNEEYVKNLEILSLSSWISLSEFPVEIGEMCNLRCLRYTKASIDHMPPRLLSKLVKLEELELSPGFSDWGLEKEGRTNASLDDIASLPLTSITIGLRKGSVLPENIVKSINRFRIHIGGDGVEDFDFYSNLLVVKDLDASNSLIEIVSEHLGGTNGIEGMDCLEEIVNGTQKPCFSKLTKIDIQGCPKLKRAFPLSVARELKQLESMKLSCCKEMEAVFYDDKAESGVKLNATSKGKQPEHIPNDQNMEARIGKAGEREVDNALVLPRLRRLLLYDMPELRVLDNRNLSIKCPSLESLIIYNCNDIEHLSYRSGELNFDKMKGHFKNISKWLPIVQENGIQQIKRLDIGRCHEMKYLADATEDPTFLRTFFSNLEKLRIWDMDSLEEIWHGPYLPEIHGQLFSSLTVLNIRECPKMKRLFPLSVATELRQLQIMKTDKCKETEEIFYNDPADYGNQVASSVRLNNPTVEESSICCPTPVSLIQCLQRKGKQAKYLPSHQIIEENVGKSDGREVDCAIIWPRLQRLCLHGMPKLRVMYNGNHAIDCPSLEKLGIIGCYNMECLSHGSISAPKIKELCIPGEWIWKNIDSCKDVVIPQLQQLDISRCHEMTCLVDAMTDQNLPKTLFFNLVHLEIRNMDSLEEIWHGPYLSIVQPQPCFTRLTQIFMWRCPKLKHVFPLSVATELTQLLKLRVETCEEIEEIFYKDQVADGNQNASSVELNSSTASAPPNLFVPTHQKTVQKATVDATIFPKLEFLYLGGLTKLRVFYDANHAIELPSLEELTIRGCHKMEALSNGSFKAPKIKDVTINSTTKCPSASEDLNTIVRKMEEEKDKDGDENEDTTSDMDEDGDEFTTSDTDEGEYP